VLLVVVLSIPGARAGAIHDAADAGDVEQVRAILSVSPSALHDLDQYGATPLGIAQDRASGAVVELLRERGGTE